MTHIIWLEVVLQWA